MHTAFTAWLILCVSVASINIYGILAAPKVHAATPFYMKTGYYWGTGTTQSITGLGFTPQMVLIKSDGSAQAVWKSSAMQANEWAYWTGGYNTSLSGTVANRTNNQISLDADGFTVQVETTVNAANIRYEFIAFAGSDCSANGTFCVGSYTGNNDSTQDITVGFQPDLFWVKSSTTGTGSDTMYRTSSMSANSAAFLAPIAEDATGAYFTTINPTGYTVGSNLNTNATLYYYAAFKSTAGQIAVGNYTGNGLATQTITGVGFVPNFVFAKASTASGGFINTTYSFGNASVGLTISTQSAYGVQASAITTLQTDGFIVGNFNNTYAHINNSSVTYRYFAFGGQAAPTVGGSFTMKVGYYTGTGSAQTITGIGFQPDLVIIKSDNSTSYSVWSLSSNNNYTNYFVNAVSITGGITGVTADGFSVGTDVSVNQNAITYEYIAFGNATTAWSGGHAADFAIGNYFGSGADGRTITGLGFQPDLVVIRFPGSSTYNAVWKSSAMPAANTAYFSGTAEDTSGTFIKTFDGDGFTLGTASAVNASGYAFQFFAFKASAGKFKVGSYSGTGVAHDETGFGFQPDWTFTKITTNAGSAVHRSSSANITGANSQYFINAANTTNMITAIVSDGISVGTSANVNTNLASYRYAAWKATAASATQPAQPTNTTPADTSTGADLNPTLTASAYSDANPHTASQWQVDTDSTFTTPDWTRTSSGAETSIVVNSTNGTFANSLAGKTALNHNTTYYWRVRYSNGTYSNWSSATSFTTNTIATPTNSSPADSGTATSLRPTLSASAFSDPQTGHTGANAQWQINTTSSFTTVIHDSGTVSYSNSYAIPASVLSDKTVYWWRVRYQDSTGQWSDYSTSTRFMVSQSLVTVNPIFGSSVVDQGDSVKINAQVKYTDGTAINNATVTLSIYNPSGTKIVTDASMPYVTGSNGVYEYAYTIPNTNGSYLYSVTASDGTNTGVGAGNFKVGTIATDIQTVDTNVDTANQTLNTINTNLSTALSNIDQLVGALIVTSSSVNDGSATTTSFVSALSNPTTDFYKNAVVTFTSGDLNGQVRRISSYDGTTKKITVSPAFTSAPGNGDTFTIVKQNVRVEEQVEDVLVDINTIKSNLSVLLSEVGTGNISGIKTKTDFINWGDITGLISTAGDIKDKTDAINWDDVAAIKTSTDSINWSDVTDIKLKTNTIDWSDITSIKNDVSYIKGKVDSIYSTLNTVDTSLASATAAISAIRTSQEKAYKARLSDVSSIQASTSYRAKLNLLDYEDNPVDAAQTPTITIYDSARSAVVSSQSMSKDTIGAYSFAYTPNASSTAGLWEAVVTTQVGSSSEQTLSDFFNVTGSPAQVIINSMSDTTVPTINANVKITNEGTGGPYEYQYDWCVVASQSNPCGGGDDVYFGSAAKRINQGADFITELGATVPNPGTYWFKLLVHYGNETSAASRMFTATAASATTEPGDTTPSETVSQPGVNSIDSLATELNSLKKVIGTQSAQLTKVLDTLGIIKPAVLSSAEKLDSVKEVQNKIADLQAVSSSIKQIVDQNSTAPVVETYMKFNSVEISFLITNPSSKAQTVTFKSFLPAEVTAESIMDLDGLKLDYDTNANSYYVSGNIELAGKQSITKTVEITDIWEFEQTDIDSMRKQAGSFYDSIRNTQYGAQALLLKTNIEDMLDRVESTQKKSYTSPQDHILTYRNNKTLFKNAQSDLDKLKDLLVQSGASQSLVGKIGGIQTFATWGIVLAIVTGFGLMCVIIFQMWRYQAMLANQMLQSNVQIQSKPKRRTRKKKEIADIHENT